MEIGGGDDRTKGKEEVTKRENLLELHSCFNKAEDDEPLFILLGRDASAPVALRFWIEDRIKRGKNKRDDPQIQDAERVITQMQDWRECES